MDSSEKDKAVHHTGFHRPCRGKTSCLILNAALVCELMVGYLHPFNIALSTAISTAFVSTATDYIGFKLQGKSNPPKPDQATQARGTVTKGRRDSLLRGPSPEKGSPQERFRQFLQSSPKQARIKEEPLSLPPATEDAAAQPNHPKTLAGTCAADSSE